LATFFPQGKLPSEQERIPGSLGIGPEVASVTEKNLDLLAKAIGIVERTRRDADGRKTAEQLCDLYCVKALPDRIAVTQLLGSLPLSRVWARSEGCNRTVFQYDPCEVERWRADRDITILANQNRDVLFLGQEFSKTVLSQVGTGWTIVPQIQQGLGERSLSPKKRKVSWQRINRVLSAAERLGLVERTRRSGP
jgi:hypothetical protein